MGHRWEGQLPGGEEIEFNGLTVGFDFIETLGLKLREGRSFSKDFGNEETTVILNEAAVKAMDITNPVGKWIQIFKTRREIIGVVQNFHFQSMHEQIEPIFILCNPKYTNTVIVKMQPGASQTAAKLKELYHRYHPGVAFEFRFLDDEYQALYIAEQTVSTLSKIFCGNCHSHLMPGAFWPGRVYG